MCVRAQTSTLGIAITMETSQKKRKHAKDLKVEITNTLNAEKAQQPPPSVVEVQAADAIFKQPTEAEVSTLNFCKLSYAHSHAQELRNEFAGLLNRGSPLE